ncbi:MAG: cache domain-containing protein, partial [Bacillota bacterium]
MYEIRTSKKKQRGLLTKIMVFIGIPVVIIYGISSFITLNMVNQSITDLTVKQLNSDSVSAANEIAGKFNAYLEISKQIAVNSQFEDLIINSQPGTPVTTTPGFPNSEKTLMGVKQSDPDNIMEAWIADVKTNQLALSKGYFEKDGYVVKERTWYKQMVEVGGPTMSAPYLDALSGKIVVTAVAPIYKSGTNEIIGAAGLDFSLDNVYKMISEYKLGNEGFYILTSNDGQIIYHPNQEYLNTNIADAKMSDNIKNAILKLQEGSIEYTNDGVESHGYVAAVGDTGWTVTTGLPEKEFASTFNAVRTISLIIILLVMIIITTLIVVISRRIVKPIKELAVVANKMAIGDINVNINEIKASSNEIMELTTAFEEMAENVKEEAFAAQKIAAGDLDLSVKPRSEKDILGISMVSVIDTLKRLVVEAEDLTAAAVEGKLSTRGNVAAFQGGYLEIIEGFNKTLDAVLEPMRVVAEHVDRIGKGDIPEKITDNYNGDFNTIIEDLNAC